MKMRSYLSGPSANIRTASTPLSAQSISSRVGSSRASTISRLISMSSTNSTRRPAKTFSGTVRESCARDSPSSAPPMPIYSLITSAMVDWNNGLDINLSTPACFASSSITLHSAAEIIITEACKDARAFSSRASCTPFMPGILQSIKQML